MPFFLAILPLYTFKSTQNSDHPTETPIRPGLFKPQNPHQREEPHHTNKKNSPSSSSHHPRETIINSCFILPGNVNPLRRAAVSSTEEERLCLKRVSMDIQTGHVSRRSSLHADVSVDWKGKPCRSTKHGGMRAAIFVLGLSFSVMNLICLQQYPLYILVLDSKVIVGIYKT